MSNVEKSRAPRKANIVSSSEIFRGVTKPRYASVNLKMVTMSYFIELQCKLKMLRI